MTRFLWRSVCLSGSGPGESWTRSGMLLPAELRPPGASATGGRLGAPYRAPIDPFEFLRSRRMGSERKKLSLPLRHRGVPSAQRPLGLHIGEVHLDDLVLAGVFFFL